MTNDSHTQITFKQQLQLHKREIDADIEAYSTHIQRITLQQYGAHARLEIDAFLSILARGGKRLRGALAIVGYEMCGGQNHAMILQAARALEMIHAHMLIVDDIQDRSLVRRGGPSGHRLLADYHREHHLAGEADHFGVALAINAGIAGEHAAQVVLANLDADPQLRLNVLSIVNRTIITTAHGQTSDIMNEMVADADAEDIKKVLQWKTAEYTFLNPLCVGMVLANADCHATDAIRDYALAAGMAFQITDDLLGTFGAEFEHGKSPMDDIREGKRTLLTAYALQHAQPADKNFLLQVLGKENITPPQFERCKDILVSSGAVDHTKREARAYVEQAQAALSREATRWPEQHVRFLRDLASYLLDRMA